MIHMKPSNCSKCSTFTYNSYAVSREHREQRHPSVCHSNISISISTSFSIAQVGIVEFNVQLDTL